MINISGNVKKKIVRILIEEIRSTERAIKQYQSQGQLFGQEKDVNEKIVMQLVAHNTRMVNFLHYIRLFGRLKPKKEGEKRGELIKKVLDRQYDVKLLTPWESNFMDDMQKCIYRNGYATYLSDKQKDILKRILTEKSKEPPEADEEPDYDSEVVMKKDNEPPF